MLQTLVERTLSGYYSQVAYIVMASEVLNGARDSEPTHNSGWNSYFGK